MFSAPIAVFSSICTVLTSVVPSLNFTVYCVTAADSTSISAFTGAANIKLVVPTFPFVFFGSTLTVTFFPAAPASTVNLIVPILYGVVSSLNKVSLSADPLTRNDPFATFLSFTLYKALNKSFVFSALVKHPSVAESSVISHVSLSCNPLRLLGLLITMGISTVSPTFTVSAGDPNSILWGVSAIAGTYRDVHISKHVRTREKILYRFLFIY